MATNFSPCKGSYVLDQFPSNVMFGMNGFHVSASGAIQGHHGPLVSMPSHVIAKNAGDERNRCLALTCKVIGPHFRNKIHPNHDQHALGRPCR